MCHRQLQMNQHPLPIAVQSQAEEPAPQTGHCSDPIIGGTDLGLLDAPAGTFHNSWSEICSPIQEILGEWPGASMVIPPPPPPSPPSDIHTHSSSPCVPVGRTFPLAALPSNSCSHILTRSDIDIIDTLSDDYAWIHLSKILRNRKPNCEEPLPSAVVCSICSLSCKDKNR